MANEKHVFYINCIMIMFVVRTEFCTLIEMWKVDENIYDCNNLNSLSVFESCFLSMTDEYLLNESLVIQMTLRINKRNW